MLGEVVNEQVRREFRVRRFRQHAVSLPLFAMVIGLGIWSLTKPEVSEVGSSLMALPIVIALAVLAFSVWNWRCPSCNGYLGKTINPKECPKCGTELR